MEIANIMLALGGDIGNTVPKSGVTAAEIAVLQAIHGQDAVFDVEIVEERTIKNRVELERLRAVYGNARDRENKAYIDLLFPGVAARVFETVDELGLADVQFKSLPVEEDDEEEVKVAPKKKAAAKGSKAKPAAPAAEDEIEDLPSDDDVMG